MNIRNDAGARMARLRKEKKLTQAELAQVLCVSQRMVAAVELGERRPSVSLAKRIGEALGFSWMEFFEDTEGGAEG
jgi:putative transcriptional regulator